MFNIQMPSVMSLQFNIQGEDNIELANGKYHVFRVTVNGLTTM